MSTAEFLIRQSLELYVWQQKHGSHHVTFGDTLNPRDILEKSMISTGQLMKKHFPFLTFVCLRNGFTQSENNWGTIQPKDRHADSDASNERLSFNNKNSHVWLGFSPKFTPKT